MNINLINFLFPEIANWTCQASNEVGHYNIEFFLRVRNNNAYLWPISGIIAEIVCSFFVLNNIDIYRLIFKIYFISGNLINRNLVV